MSKTHLGATLLSVIVSKDSFISMTWWRMLMSPTQLSEFIEIDLFDSVFDPENLESE